MRFVIDENLPPRLASYLVERGHEAIHVADLPTGLSSTDSEIISWAELDGAVVVSKDFDYRSLQMATGKPSRLLNVATGNIRTSDLLDLFGSLLDEVVTALHWARYLELHQTMLVINDS